MTDTKQVTCSGWTAVLITDGPTNPDRITLDRLGVWRFDFTTNHRGGRVSLNGRPYLVNVHLLRRASGSGRVLVDPDDPDGVPVGSYLTLEVRDKPHRFVDAKLSVYHAAI
jgi:hypothetical protein